jgi:hypothetical protein
MEGVRYVKRFLLKMIATFRKVCDHKKERQVRGPKGMFEQVALVWVLPFCLVPKLTVHSST